MPNVADAIPAHFSRYRLEQELGRGGMGVVYRAYDRLEQRPVAVKRIEADGVGERAPSSRASAVTWRLPPPQDLAQVPASRLPDESGSVSGEEQLRTALAREFRILASLRHPNIISVLDYGFDGSNRPYLVMELLEAARSVDDAVCQLEPQQKARVIVQIIQALRYLHRAGVVHRDLKPENVLVIDQAGESVAKLVDFGLALPRTQIGGELSVAGTLAYMAPELVLGAPPSKAADIYALGMLIFELMTGGHPFDGMAMSELISASRRGTVNFAQLNLPDDARLLVETMIAPKPSDRPSEVGEVLATWCRTMSLQLPLEPVEVRNSFLEAASFVARDDELKRLMKAMRRAAVGQGSSWLISGLSGVGKSRLMQELQATALVSGALVLHGQALDAGGQSFAVWRNVLREAAIHVHLDDLEVAVLSGLVDDLEVLLGRTVEAAPELNREASFRRLNRVIHRVFERLEGPTLVLLEDVHWATPASVAVLRALVTSVPERKCLLVCSLRSDERPSWLAELPGVLELSLEPFDRAGIASLCEAMLGGSESVAALVEPLQEVCGGNAFYIVELLRSLAEQRGSLEQAAAKLRERALHSDPKQLLEARLGYVSKEARETLELAAVSGRQLSLSLLGEFHDDVAGWLQHCSAARIIEVVDNSWRFSHDKLREWLLERMAPMRRRALHGQIARYLEQLRLPDMHAHALAYHYDEAGERDRALPFLLLAGEQSLAHGAVHHARRLASRAVKLDDRGPGGTSLSELQRARALRMLIESSYALALSDDAVKYTNALLELFDLQLGGSRAERLRRIYRGGLLSLGSASNNPAIFKFLRRYDNDVLRVAMEGIGEGCRVHLWLGNRREAGYLLLVAHGVSHAAGLRARVALCRGVMAYGLSMTPLRRIAEPLMARARAAQPPSAQPRRRTMLLELSGLTALNAGAWDDTRHHFEKLLSLSAKNGDERGHTFALTQICLAAQLRGDLVDAEGMLDNLRTRMGSNTDHPLRTMIHSRVGWVNVYRGNYPAAIEAFRSALEHRTIRMAEISVRGGLALALYLHGQRRDAFAEAQDTLSSMRLLRLNAHGGVLAWPATAFVCIERWRETQTHSHLETAESAMAELKQLARLLPLASSCHLRLRGRLLHLRGQHRQAMGSLRASVAAAAKSDMQLDRLMAELEWAEVAGTEAHAKAERARRGLRERRALGCLRMSTKYSS